MFEIGNSLREARERQGLEFSQLEADTKIRAKFLRALEEERFDVLPADSYARGFLEVYATRLGLDRQLYADEFDSRFARGEGESEGVRRVRTDRRLRFEASALALGLLGIMVVTVLVIAAWQFSGGSDGSETATAPLPASQPAEPAPVAPTPSVPQPPVEEAPVSSEPAAPVADAELTVTAIAPSARVT
ncbi:MAG: helix-turn-helix domain-containing protein, partial [Gaiellaceae bacterium]